MTVKIHYYDIGDYLDREAKLEKLKEFKNIEKVEWQTITPNNKHDWINQRNDDFEAFFLLASKNRNETTIFDVFSMGVVTARDSWCYNFFKKKLTNNMKRMIDFYNEQREAYHKHKKTYKENAELVGDFIDTEPTKISWTRSVKKELVKGTQLHFQLDNIVTSMYRPFCKSFVYFNRQFNECVYQMPKIFPNPEAEKIMIGIEAPSAKKDFTTLVTKTLCDYHLFEASQCFPFYVYETMENSDKALFKNKIMSDYLRRENITDAALQKFREHYNDATITKWDIFYYVYGILNSNEYKTRFASELKKQLPRIPFAKDFWGFSHAGKKLSNLHLNYETLQPYELKETRTGQVNYHVTKMSYASKTDKTKIIYNRTLTLEDIPEIAQRYIVNGKSALDWILDRYQVSTHKESRIVNDPNDWCEEHNDPEYIVNLIKRIVTLSVESVKIIDTLPEMGI
jgi:predicted helicase